MTVESDTEAALRERIRELEGDLRAQAKTIDVLMARVEGGLAKRSTAFTLFDQNITLEAMVAARTRELREQGERLSHALEELRRTQTQLVHAHKLEAIGSLAAGVAHEINTPVQYVGDNVTFLGRAFMQLTAVARAAVEALAAPNAGLAYPELARVIKKAKLDYLLAQVPRALDQSKDGLARIAAIVGAMKEFSHPASVDKEPVDLAHAIQTTLTVARNEWKYVAEVESSFDPSLPFVPALRNELNQVFLNLIVNAAHAIAEVTQGKADAKGVIRITTRAVDGFALIEISDSGTGIPEHIRSRIFDPFFTTKAVGKGTGQGLAIAYNVVVERHGGHIEVDSVVGSGSTFTVKLPLHGQAISNTAVDTLVTRSMSS